MRMISIPASVIAADGNVKLTLCETSFLRSRSLNAFRCVNSLMGRSGGGQLGGLINSAYCAPRLVRTILPQAGNISRAFKKSMVTAIVGGCGRIPEA